MNLQLTLAARYLWGRKLRTFLTTLAIVFGVLVIFGMNILIPTVLKAFESNLLAASGQVDITVTQKSGDAFDASILNKVESVRGVRAASGSLSRNINIPDNFYGHGRAAKIGAVTLTGIEPKAAQQLRDYPMKEGRFLRASDENRAVIATSLADQLGLKLGDKLYLPVTVGVVKLTIVGLRPERALAGSEEVLVTLPDAQKWLDLSNRINTIEANMNTTDQTQRDAIQKEIETRLGSNYHLGALGSGSELFASLQTSEAALNMLGFLALFMGGFIILNTFRTIVAERRHDIGMLRAIGASRRTIIGLFLTEGLLQGVIGTAIGMGLGYLLGAGMVIIESSVTEQFLHLKLGAPTVELALVVTAIALGVGVTLFAGLLPAFSASRVTPMEALRPTVVQVEKRARGKGTIIGALLIAIAVLSLASKNVALVSLGGLMCLIGLVLVAPALVKPIADIFGAMLAGVFAREGTGTLAEGNLTRQPSRAAITASATMIGLAIIVATTGLMTSLMGGVTSLTEKTLGSGYLLVPPAMGVWGSNVGASPELADKLRSVNGVSAVSTMRYDTSSVSGIAAKGSGSGDTLVAVLGIDPVIFPQVSGLNFQAGDPKNAYAELASQRAIIVNGIFAAQTGVQLGDMVNLSTAEGRKNYRVVGIASDMLNAKIMTAYISQDNIVTDFRKTEDVFIQLTLTPNADRAQVESRLKTITAKYPQFKLISGKAYLDEISQQFSAVFAMLYGLLAVLAL
ncbi:MAG: ABC transporter permease, partial [Chloroflexi bacterium]|nr:ABC transporter permease [Chloroflexota bacterium]